MTNFDAKVELNVKDVYQLLVGNLRYGYTRNNHLMPSCAYEQTKRIINDFINVDENYAINTLKQICNECISEEICMRFCDGVDDECGNREESIQFVWWCIKTINKYIPEWKPNDFDRFENNIAKDELNLYSVKVINGGSNFANGLTSKNGLFSFISENVFDGAKSITYSKERLTDLESPYAEGFVLHCKGPRVVDIRVLRLKENYFEYEKD